MKMYHNPYKQFEFQQNLKPHKSHPELYYTKALERANNTDRDRLKNWKNETLYTGTNNSQSGHKENSYSSTQTKTSQIYPSMVRDHKQFDKLQNLRKSHPEFQYDNSQTSKKHVSKIILPPLLSSEKLASYKKLNHDETSAFSKVKKEKEIQHNERDSRQVKHRVSSQSSSGDKVSAKRLSKNVFVTLQPKDTIKSHAGSTSSVTFNYFASPPSTLSRGEVVSTKSNYTEQLSTGPSHQDTSELSKEKTRVRPSKLRGRKKLSVFVNNHSVALAKGKAISLSLGNIPEAVELDINNNETPDDAIITYINRENGTTSNSTGSNKENIEDQRIFAVAEIKADTRKDLHRSSEDSIHKPRKNSTPVIETEIKKNGWEEKIIKHQSDVSKAAIKSATVGSSKKSRPSVLQTTPRKLSLDELEPKKDWIKQQEEASIFRMQFGDCPLPLPKNCLKHTRLLTMEFDFIQYLDLWRLSSSNFGFNLGFGLCDDKRHYTHIIKRVEADSVGDKAGVKAGNIILAVNHLNVETLNHDQMLNVWKSRGQNVKLHTIESWAYPHYAKRCHPCATCYTDHALFLDNEEKNKTPGTPVIPHRSIITRSAKKSTTEKVKDTGTVDWLYVGAPGPIYPTFDCPSCHERFNHETAIEIDKCYHRFCGKCLVQAVKNAKDISVRCPFPNCKQEISHKQMVQFLTYDELEKFLRISLRLAERYMLNTFHCRTPGCPGYYIMVPGATAFECPVCGQSNCLTCKEIHAGTTCNKYMIKRGTKAIAKTEKAINNMSKYKKAVRCPSCGYIVMKDDDSENMNCRKCKRSFKVSNIY